MEAEADWDHLHRPDVPRLRRNERFTAPDDAAFDQRDAYELPERLRSNHGPSAANGRSGASTSSSTKAGASPSGSMRVTRISCSRRTPGPIPFRYSSTVSRPARHTAWTSTRTETARFERAACTSSFVKHDAVRERTLEITFLEPETEAYSFTFR